MRGFRLAVQWHPEVGADPRLFEALVDGRRARAERLTPMGLAYAAGTRLSMRRDAGSTSGRGVARLREPYVNDSWATVATATLIID